MNLTLALRFKATTTAYSFRVEEDWTKGGCKVRDVHLVLRARISNPDARTVNTDKHNKFHNSII